MNNKSWHSACLILGPDDLVPLVLDPAQKKPLWKFPGGSNERDETHHATASRELEEETGLKVSSLKFLTHQVRQGHLFLLYVGQISSFADLKERGSDGEKIKLVPVNKLETMPDFLPDHRRVLLEWKRRISSSRDVA